MLFTEARMPALTLYTSFVYAVTFSFFGGFTFVLTEDYGFNQREVGLAFIGIMFGYVLESLMFGFIDKTLYAKARTAAMGNLLRNIDCILE